MRIIVNTLILFGVTFMPPDVFSDALCANKKTGSVRYAPSCKNGVEISIQQGQQGPAGPQGPKGDAGASGGVSGSDCRPYNNAFHKYTYSHVNALIGSRIFVKGTPYDIYKIPFYEISTGKHYAATIPYAVTISNIAGIGTYSATNGSLSTTHLKNYAITDCASNKINGFNVLLNVNDLASYTVSKNDLIVGGTTQPQTFKATKSAYITLSIQVGDTLVYIFIAPPATNIVSSNISFSDFDLTNFMDWSQAHDPLEEVQAAEQLANYVWVEAIP